MLGIPGLSLPVGVSSLAGSQGLPLALQLMGPPWHEATLLRVGAALEGALAAAGVPLPRSPQVHINPLAAAAEEEAGAAGAGGGG
jgi:Asp-tRNA(Asn)/Glu-tRNA(Gln) amidotransferase A subunit family amidase